MPKLRLLVGLFYALVVVLLFSIWGLEKMGEVGADGTRKSPLFTAGVDEFYDEMESRLLEYRLRFLLETPPPEERVAIVSLGWRAEKIYGPPPWPRDLFAELISKLRLMGVKTIVLDPIFADAQLRVLSPAAYASLFPALPLDQIRVVNPFNYVGELQKKLAGAEAALKKRADVTPEALATFAQQRARLLKMARGIARGDANRAFERVVLKGDDVIFPSDYSNIPKFAGSKKAAIEGFYRQGLVGVPRAERIEGYKHVLTLYPRLLTGPKAAQVGINELDRKQERFISGARLAVRFRDRLFFGSMVHGVAHFTGKKARLSWREGAHRLHLGDREVALREDGMFPLAYYNEPAFPRVISGIEVLRERVPASKLRGKLVILDVRTRHTRAYLHLPTPLGRMWASEIKATLASNLLLGHRGPTVQLSDPFWLLTIEALGILLLGGLFVFLVFRVSLLKSALLALVLMVVVGVLDALVLTEMGYWYALAILFFEIPILMIINVGAHYLMQRAERQKVRRAFGYYLPERVLEHMLGDADALKLGGERRELSILFSDIRGFTTVSEKADPVALGEALNVHLTALTEAVFEHEGTLDKYMGDCVMAFFGAPVAQKQHALYSVRSALRMQQRLRAIQPVWRQKCGQEIAIGVGVATGDVIVGNMGSDKLFDYTVIGDVANLASRLEGLTKVYGVEVLVSEATCRQTEDAIAYLEVDRVRVKGKKEPVSIYEAICEGEVDAIRARYDQLCGEGIEAFRQQRWDAARECFEGAQKERPEAQLPALYLGRIAELRESDLPADWDGVTDFTHK